MISEEKIIDKLNLLSKEQLKYILEHSQDDTDTIEAYGYLRGVRDFAFEIGVLSFTTLDQDLKTTTYHLFDI